METPAWQSCNLPPCWDRDEGSRSRRALYMYAQLSGRTAHFDNAFWKNTSRNYDMQSRSTS